MQTLLLVGNVYIYKQLINSMMKVFEYVPTFLHLPHPTTTKMSIMVSISNVLP